MHRSKKKKRFEAKRWVRLARKREKIVRMVETFWHDDCGSTLVSWDESCRDSFGGLKVGRQWMFVFSCLVRLVTVVRA